MKILRIRAGSVIINQKSQILLIYRKGKWDLPKGKVSKKGKLLTAAIDESIEETGLKKKLRLINHLKNLQVSKKWDYSRLLALLQYVAKTRSSNLKLKRELQHVNGIRGRYNRLLPLF